MKLQLRRSQPPTLRERIVERIPLEQIMERLPMRRPEPPSRIRRFAPLIGAGAAGAALAFVFDPYSGRGRREKAREFVGAKVSGARHLVARAEQPINDSSPDNGELLARIGSER